MNVEFSCDYFGTGKDAHGQILVHAENVRLSQTIDAKAFLSQIDMKEIIEYIEEHQHLDNSKSTEAA